MKKSDLDVLVVGAGPVGLFCANELIRHGLNCRIIDKKPGLSQHSKALGIHIRTLEMLQDCGFYQDFMQEGIPIYKLLLKTKHKKIFEVNFNKLDAMHDFLLDLAQDKTENILYQGLLNNHLHVEWQTELMTIEYRDGLAIAQLKDAQGITESLTAPWIIACDGAHSTLRHLIGAPFVGTTYPQHWLLADLYIDWQHSENKMIAYLNPEGPLACFPLGGKRYRLVLSVPESQLTYDLEELKSLFHQRTTDKAILSHPIWITPFSIHHRQVTQYQHHNIFFCGDAAHIHSPLGAQGMNTGMQDVYNLVWKLALVHKGYAHQDLLASYQEERFPIGQQVLRKTDVMTKMVLIKNPWLATLRNQSMRLFMLIPCLRKKILRGMAQLNIAYRSVIIKQLGKKTRFKVGTYIPLIYLKNSKTQTMMPLAAICQGTQHHLLLFITATEQAENILNYFSCFPMIQIHFIYLEGKPCLHQNVWTWEDKNALNKEFRISLGTALLVRPDKYIGLIQSPFNREKLKQALVAYSKLVLQERTQSL